MTINSQPSIACVVVTFNRKELLAKTIAALLRQSYRPKAIIVIDNDSTDGTTEFLRKKKYLSEDTADIVHYRRLPVNIGGAGGFNEGMKLALEGDYDWLLLIDDDAYPEPNALENLKMYFNREGVIALACNIYGEDKKIQHHHRGLINFKRFFPHLHVPLNKNLYNQDVVEIDMASFVGLTVQCAAVRKIGLPKKEFFIHHDDVEYSLRLRNQGKILLVTSSWIIHKEGNRQYWKKVFGRSSIRIPSQRIWMNYFTLRNAVFLGRKNLPISNFGAQLIISFAQQLVGIMVYDDWKVYRAICLTRAFMDGLRGNFDNRFPFELRRKMLQKTA